MSYEIFLPIKWALEAQHKNEIIQNSNNIKNGHNDKKWAKNVAELGETGMPSYKIKVLTSFTFIPSYFL